MSCNSVSKPREVPNQENEDSYQGCEILNFMDFPTVKNSKFFDDPLKFKLAKKSNIGTQNLI